MFKYVFIVIAVAAGVYIGMNWDKFSGNMEDKLDAAKDLKKQTEDIHENAKETFEDLVDKVK